MCAGAAATSAASGVRRVAPSPAAAASAHHRTTHLGGSHSHQRSRRVSVATSARRGTRTRLAAYANEDAPAAIDTPDAPADTSDAAAGAGPALEILGRAGPDGNQIFDDDELPDNLFDAVGTAALVGPSAALWGMLWVLLVVLLGQLRCLGGCTLVLSWALNAHISTCLGCCSREFLSPLVPSTLVCKALVS
jgi:hypothetical protein